MRLHVAILSPRALMCHTRASALPASFCMADLLWVVQLRSSLHRLSTPPLYICSLHQLRSSLSAPRSPPRIPLIASLSGKPKQHMVWQTRS